MQSRHEQLEELYRNPAYIMQRFEAVLDSQKRIEDKLDSLKDDAHQQISGLKVAVGALQVKASVWGGLGGLIAAVSALLVAYLRGH